jgi:hypothetical protein
VNGNASSTVANSYTSAADVVINDTLNLLTGDTVEIYGDYDGGATTVTVEAGTSTTMFGITQL